LLAEHQLNLTTLLNLGEFFDWWNTENRFN